MSRWWSVGACADQLVQKHDEWIMFMNYIYEVYSTSMAHVHEGTNLAIAKIAKGGVAAQKNPKLMADLYFFHGFCKIFFNKHMEQLHETNPISNTFGYACHDMSYHVFEMITELKSLMRNN